MRRAAIPLALFATVALTHALGIITSFDARWSIPMARSLIREGNVDLDEYPALLEENRYYAIGRIGGRLYSEFPIGASILALPAVWLVDTLELRVGDARLEKLTASVIVALTAVLLYLIARRALAPPGAVPSRSSSPSARRRGRRRAAASGSTVR